VVSLLPALCCALCLSVTRAQAAPTEDASSPEVEALVQQGIELRRAGKDQEALAAFQAAAEREPGSMRTKLHLAAAHQALGHWQDADTLLREALRAEDDPYVQRHRATLEKAAEFVGRRMGTLDVTGTAGAEVRVNGKAQGTLPLSAPLRMPVGSYTLEVRLEGHYSVSRPVAITSRGITRESFELAQLDKSSGSWSGTGPGLDADRGAGSPSWLTWSLTGASALAAGASVVALIVREQHAERWNSDDCLAPGRTRGDVCRAELNSGQDAERVAYITGGAALLLGTGALVSWALQAPSSSSSERQDAASCGVTLGGAVCSGAF
jgi:hypothetical protein